MLVFYTYSDFMKFQFGYLAFYLFSVIDCFAWFYMGSLCKNTQFVLDFLKAPFLGYTFPTIQ